MARTQVHPARIRRPGRSETGQALSLSARLPRLALEARRVAASLQHGTHGRRRSGPGETFWQFRPFVTGESAGRIDWRRSGRDDRLYVREREWESPHAAWLWIDRSPSMAFSSSLGPVPKVERAVVLGLALADLLVETGERVGLLGLSEPTGSRRVAERICETLALASRAEDDDLPPARAVGRFDGVLLISDCLSPLPEITRRVEAISARGARGHLLMILDPAEETFPFDGQAVLHDLEDGVSLRVGDAAAWGVTYRSRMAAHRAALADLARRRGWTFTLHRTDRPATEAALKVLTLLSAAAKSS